MNYWTYILLTSIPVGIIFFLGGKRVFHKLVRRKAITLLEENYFVEEKKRKKEILYKFSEMTNFKYSDDELVDYYLKIKGLQNLNKVESSNFWIKHYLSQKTDIKLSYYEQRSFIKAFNRPRSQEKSKKSNTRKSTSVKLPKQSLSKTS